MPLEAPPSSPLLSDWAPLPVWVVQGLEQAQGQVSLQGAILLPVRAQELSLQPVLDSFPVRGQAQELGQGREPPQEQVVSALAPLISELLQL